MSLSCDVSAARVLFELENYAYNSMELCRLLNDLDPFEFKGCHFKTKDKPWGTSKNGCQGRCRGCKILNSTLYSRLRRLEKRGKISSVKLVWFDGRNPETNGFKKDQFRLWFTNREGLATRLIQDVQVHVAEVYAW